MSAPHPRMHTLPSIRGCSVRQHAAALQPTRMQQQRIPRTVVCRGIKDDRRAVRGGDVAAPEVAVQRCGLNIRHALKQLWQPRAQRLAQALQRRLLRQRALRAQPLLREELHPAERAAFSAPAVALRRAANGVVHREAEAPRASLLAQRLRLRGSRRSQQAVQVWQHGASCSHCVHQRQPPAQRRLVGAGAQREVLHNEEAASRGERAGVQRPRHTQRARRRHRAQAPRLALKHGRAAPRGLHEVAGVLCASVVSVARGGAGGAGATRPCHSARRTPSRSCPAACGRARRRRAC